ncbi:LysR substrate-binding domain-containing protein [Modestobacter sp. VKM Ac-2978]|uniref:LysR substrate-binding domain-containing protein n=1 Tax=Modestobacter sp. VKM Ac-2978 TaxID=3004132 RepID=UPI0022AA7BEB|nr:LysR substrate-binding domain-containing protein [Modestobacter sp. VKM Ac-2978]MCZ2849117.1 LysR substrate-binding domain-containing protein [Modestobacter sp. VKM Ac-2978]
MDLRHLRYFLAVADELHFGRAAARLHIAQPPLSQQIQRLERELGVQLFERDRRHVRLTRAGEVLQVEARRTVAQADRLLDVAEDVRTGGTGRVRLGFVGSSLYGQLPALLRAVRQQAPQLTVSAVELESGPQLAGLLEDTLDLGVLRPPASTPSLAVQVIEEEELVVALPKEHPLPVGRPVALADLADEPFVLFARTHGEGFWQVVTQACGQAGFSPNIVYDAEHVHTMVGLVASGMGVSLVPQAVRRLNLTGVRYERLAGTAPRLPLALAWDPRRSFPALERVLEIVTVQARRTAGTARPWPSA